jgi:DNA-binding MarR family transcriptional regulator
MREPARTNDEGARQFVEHMARIFADWGFPRMAARVLMTMMIAEGPLTAGELAERLGVSPAAISGAVRYLIQLSMVARDPVPGSRRDRYRLVDQSWYALTLKKTTLFQVLADLAEEGTKALGGPETPGGARVAEMRDYFLYVNEELPALLNKWERTRIAPEP